jgi:hypothetical protein
MRTRFILRFDDIAVNMHVGRFYKIVSLLKDLKIVPILGVIPLNCDEKLLKMPLMKENFWEVIRDLQCNQGWSIFQHGTYHVYETKFSGILKVNDKSEFSGLPLNNQFELLELGYNEFLKNDIRVDGFMAPSHSFDIITLIALKKLGIGVITDGYSLRPKLFKELIISIPQLFSSFRTFLGLNGIYTVCVHINTMSDKEFDSLLNDIKINESRFTCVEVVKRYACLLRHRRNYLSNFLDKFVYVFFIIFRILNRNVQLVKK